MVLHVRGIFLPDESERDAWVLDGRLTFTRPSAAADTVAAGGWITPGFVDAHAHPLMFGQLMTWVDCGPEKAGSIPEGGTTTTPWLAKLSATGCPIANGEATACETAMSSPIGVSSVYSTVPPR